MRSTNKDSRITVRLTPNQDFTINVISKKINKSKSAVVRFAIEELIRKYNNATGE